MTQRLVLVTAPVVGLMSLQSHPRIIELHQCPVAKSIAKLRRGISIFVWIANSAKSLKHIPKHMTIGISATRTQIYIPPSRDCQKETDTYDRRSPYNLIFDVHATQVTSNSALPEEINQHFENSNTTRCTRKIKIGRRSST